MARKSKGAVDSQSTTCQISESEIVDLCTKLIFGDIDDLSEAELLIISALRLVASGIYSDSIDGMGDYLRDLEVLDMIELVGEAKTHLDMNNNLLDTHIFTQPSLVSH